MDKPDTLPDLVNEAPRSRMGAAAPSDVARFEVPFTVTDAYLAGGSLPK
jgi:hypothetical protein